MLTLVRAACRAYDGHSRFAAEPSLAPYLADMGRPYGAELVITEPEGHSHAEMAEPLIDELADGQPIDVLILAQRMHDVSPGRATATYLAGRCAGNPLAFALCDQGTAAPFTALRLMSAYECRRALLLIVEQATLHYTPVTPVDLPNRHTAVALLLAAGPGGIEIRQSTVDDGVDLCADVVLRGSRDLPLTGPWWQLATGMTELAGKRVLLTDHDRATGLRSTAVLDLPPGG